jgi:hypothetical protein
MYGYVYKPPPSMRTRILKALRAEGPARGQAELGRRVLGPNATLDDWTLFTLTMRSMLAQPRELVETKTQTPGTGVEHMAHFEYIYSLLPSETRA